MRVVGFRYPEITGVQVGELTEDGSQVTVIAPLEEFWSDARGHLARGASGKTACGTTASRKTLSVSDVQLVPPVPADARVICIGLNYLKHVAEGSLRDQPLPEFPTLFAR